MYGLRKESEVKLGSPARQELPNFDGEAGSAAPKKAVAADARRMRMGQLAGHEHEALVKNVDSKMAYHVNLKMYYETKMKESICVCGSIPELGNWKEFKCHMKWTEGHIWVTEEPIVTDKYFFTYKYLALGDNRTTLIGWERGVDRIADLEVLPNLEFSEYGQLNLQGKYKGREVKNVEINDDWENFIVKFSVSHPVDESGDQLSLEGNVSFLKNISMARPTLGKDWMPIKYGKGQYPWECEVLFPNEDGSNHGQWKESSEMNKIEYSFVKKNAYTNINQKEREPKRTFQIQDPSRYRGQLGAQGTDLWSNTDKVFMVNGFVQKADGNFIGPFFFKTISNSNITIGSFPMTAQDVEMIKAAGCTAVLDIMTPSQHKQRGLENNKLEILYRDAGLQLIKHQEVDDVDEEEYALQVFQAALVLDEIVGKGHNVYLHCAKGISRGPTLLVIYMALFLRHPQWYSHDDIAADIKDQYALSDPNM